MRTRPSDCSGMGKVYIARQMKRKKKHKHYSGTIVSVKFTTAAMSKNGAAGYDSAPMRFA